MPLNTIVSLLGVVRKRALVAVAHSILIIAYHILKQGTTYQELGADYFDRPSREGTVRYLSRRLQRLGFAVTLTDLDSASIPSFS